MTNVKYDLKDRIFRYVIAVLNYLKKLPDTPLNRIIINQCSRSVTSIGANYKEADVAHTRKDFTYKMETVRKETKETSYWLRISRTVNPVRPWEECGKLQNEGVELTRIFSSIIQKSKRNK